MFDALIMIQNITIDKKLHGLSCFVQLKCVLLISRVFWIFVQTAGSQLCLRFFCFLSLKASVLAGTCWNLRACFDLVVMEPGERNRPDAIFTQGC